MAWPKVKFAKGKGPIDQVFRAAAESPPPAKAQELYQDNFKVKLLAGLCRELQKNAGEDVFYLGTRTAGKLLKVSHKTTSRWFFLLENDGFIKTIRKGLASVILQPPFLYSSGGSFLAFFCIASV